MSVTVSSSGVYYVLRLAVLQRLRLIIKTSLLGSYMRKTTRSLRRLNISPSVAYQQNGALAVVCVSGMGGVHEAIVKLIIH